MSWNAFLSFFFPPHIDTPSITAKLINEQKEDKEKKNYEEKEKVKAENGFQDNYSVVVASGMFFLLPLKNGSFWHWRSVGNHIYQQFFLLLMMFRKMLVPN